MKSALRLLVAAAAISFGADARSQSILVNGDFEIVNQAGCNSNIPNSQLTSYLPGIVAFGTANSIDVYTNPPCYGLPAYQGVTKIAIGTGGWMTGYPADAFSIPLTSPVVAGSTYTLSFAACNHQVFIGSVGGVQVGLSDNPLSFGTQVGAFSVGVLNWTVFTSTFTAPVGAQYMTVRSGTTQGWSHVDDFMLVPNGSMSYCAGDGAGTACPCGNNSPAGSYAGCANSMGIAGRLRSVGYPSLAADTLVLTGDHMSSSSALYFQGTAQTAGGAGSLFGDGLRCASGTIVRLGIKINISGSSQYPEGADAHVSVRGQVTAPGTRDYQVWYRNAAAFCTPSTFNFTNGLEVTWTP